MYPVSNEYLSQMEHPEKKRLLRGTIGAVTFTEADIVKDTLTISNQCSESGEVKLGAVYTALFECTFIQGLIEREKWKGLRIEIAEGIYLENGATEFVPLGVFFVDEAIHGEKGVTIKAYDAMISFERDFAIDTTYGTLFELATLACRECGVNLENTKEQMNAFPNGTEEFMLHSENDVETWRDFLFWLGQACAAFWTINRNGKLELRSYGMTVKNTVSRELRNKNASFYDFTTGYTGVTLTRADTKEQVVFTKGENDKLTYDLGTNPFLQYGSDAEREKHCRAILEEISVLEYVPFAARVLHGSMYDLGDVVRFTGGRAENEKICCVMYWEYDGKYFDLEGFGSDPATSNAKTKADKAIQGLASSTKTETVQYYLFTNAEQIHISDGEQKKIIDIRFASNKATTVIFNAELLLEVESKVDEAAFYDAKCTIYYRYNDLYLDEHKPKEVYTDGNHIMHLLYYFEVQSALVSRLEVLMEMDGGSVDIAPQGIKSSVYGQALAVSDAWDGTITIRQTLERRHIGHPIKHVIGKGIREAVTTAFQTPEPWQITDTIPIMRIGHPTKHVIGVGIVDIGMESWEEEKETGNVIHVINEETEDGKHEKV